MHQDPSTYSSNMNILPQFPEHEHLNCPRCDSTNTKFCYYNNYNLSQPRHFCKNCRRYWTKGGTLRKIPIGGGTRKATKRSSPATTPPVLPPSPPAQLKPELSPMFDSSNDLGQVRLNHREQFGGFVDVLKQKLSDGSENGGLNGAPATTPPLLPPSPSAQLKPELSPMFDFSNDLGKVRLNHQEQFGSFVDVLKPKLSDGSDDGGMNGAPATGVFLRNYLSVNDDDDNDRIRSGGESSGCDDGENGWPNLSISSSGSNFS